MVYFQIRRSSANFYSGILNDIVLMLLWLIPVIFEGNISLVPMFFDPAIDLISDCYGLHNWIKLENTQKEL